MALVASQSKFRAQPLTAGLLSKGSDTPSGNDVFYVSKCFSGLKSSACPDTVGIGEQLSSDTHLAGVFNYKDNNKNNGAFFLKLLLEHKG